jgi:hypothetical protein
MYDAMKTFWGSGGIAPRIPVNIEDLDVDGRIILEQFKSWDSSVGIATDYGLDDRMIGV